jgi:hypothetical protein
MNVSKPDVLPWPTSEEAAKWESAAQKVPPHTAERPHGRGLNKRKLGTILAALRYWQRQDFTNHPPHPERDIATDGGTQTPLTSHEIDCLCMRLNS